MTAVLLEFFGFAPTAARHVRIVITSIDKPYDKPWELGEVAFKPASDTAAVPELGAVWLFLPPFGVLAFVRRRRMA